MILLIDNYDSFSYNLYQLAGSLYPDLRVIRNDAYTLEEIEAMHPEGLLLSPGPGRPEDAGVTVPSIPYFAGKLPILGVCLGHQAICQAFGAAITYAKELVHGKSYDVILDTESPLFSGMPRVIKAARYHSLAADPKTIPDCLTVTARTQDGDGHGRLTQGLLHLRPPVPSRVHHDPDGREDPRKLLYHRGN